MAPRTRPAAERFWLKVNKDGPVMRPGLSQCWVFMGGRDRDGYGQFTDKPITRAHVFAWTGANGPRPAGMFVCHHCDNPPCVRPDHLYLGTATDNNRDTVRRGRWDGCRGRNMIAKTHCLRGHPFDAENTYLHEGKRHCRACRRSSKRRRRGAGARD